MKMRDKILYMTYGAGLVVLGMVLNSFLVTDADAQGSVKDATFRNITCHDIQIVDNSVFSLVIEVSSLHPTKISNSNSNTLTFFIYNLYSFSTKVKD